MFSSLKQRCLSFLVFLFLGLSLGIIFTNFSVLAITPNSTITVGEIEAETKAVTLERQGNSFYFANDFDRAVEYWEEAVEAYATPDEILSRSRVLGNLALAYARLGAWEQAEKAVAASLSLLNNDRRTSLEDRTRVLAQVLNNQGILHLTRGKTEAAIATWEKARDNYQAIGDELGVIRTSVEMADGLKNLGLLRRALNTFSSIAPELDLQPDSQLKATAMRNFGELNRLVGNYQQSRKILQESWEIAETIDTPLEKVKTLLALGNSWEAEREDVKALELYHQALSICSQASRCLQSELPLQINLAQLNLLLETEYWQRGVSLIPQIETGLRVIKSDRTHIYQQLNFAGSLIKLREKKQSVSQELESVPAWTEIEEIVTDANRRAIALNANRAESYAWGLQGKISENLQQWDKAQWQTQQASQIAQKIDAPEIDYLWQWQLGRISQAQQERERAIAYYTAAVETIELLSQDLVAVNSDIQYSFRESVEPIYRGLVRLLLAANTQKQTDLKRARNVVESLQIAELNNFFREACIDAQPVNIDFLDRQAAIIYPIILRDRLEIIITLPDRSLRHYTSAIAQDELETIIEQFRQDIVVRSRRQFYAPAKQLYNLLIRPAVEELKRSGVETLVFVPDGSLRNIPLAALYDGREYLIEQYRVSVTPGLQLLPPRSLERVKFETIAAGLSKPTQGFSGLDYVPVELAKVKRKVSRGSRILMNREFTSKALKREIELNNYPIVHIATHGQFSSDLDDTFLLAWNSKIEIGELENILQTRTPTANKAIELLVLSACETATGDKRAALGLAGIAVRAGAKSTVATLWSVEDLTTAELMGQFYQTLTTKNVTKAEAIRQAQLSLLHSRWHQHPFYWASYILLGNWL